MSRRTIRVDEWTDKMRYRCPNGHAGSSIEPTNNHWWCRSCARAAKRGSDVTPEFDELLDQKTGDRLVRDDVRLVGGDPVTGVGRHV